MCAHTRAHECHDTCMRSEDKFQELVLLSHISLGVTGPFIQGAILPATIWLFLMFRNGSLSQFGQLLVYMQG